MIHFKLLLVIIVLRMYKNNFRGDFVITNGLCERYLWMDFKSLIHTYFSFLHKSQIYYFLFLLFSHIIVLQGIMINMPRTKVKQRIITQFLKWKLQNKSSVFNSGIQGSRWLCPRRENKMCIISLRLSAFVKWVYLDWHT